MVGTNVNYFEYDRKRSFPHLDNFSCRHRQGKHSKPCPTCREDYGKFFANPRFFATTSSSWRECEKCGVGRYFYTWKDEGDDKAIEEKWEDEHTCYNNKEEGLRRQLIIEAENSLHEIHDDYGKKLEKLPNGKYGLHFRFNTCTDEYVRNILEQTKNQLTPCFKCSKMPLGVCSVRSDGKIECRNCSEKSYECKKCKQYCSKIYHVEGGLCESCYNQKDTPPPPPTHLPNQSNQRSCGCWVRCWMCKKTAQTFEYFSFFKEEMDSSNVFCCNSCMKNCSKCKNDKSGSFSPCENHIKKGTKEDFPLIKPTIKEIEEYFSNLPFLNNFKKAYYLTDDYLVIEYTKEHLLPDIFTTDSEGRFLGYEKIEEEYPVSKSVEIAKGLIQQTLNKLNIKVNQLSKEFWNWTEDILKLKSSKEVEQFSQNMLRTVERERERERERESSSFNTPLIIGGCIFGGILLIGITALLVRKSSKKKKKK